MSLAWHALILTPALALVLLPAGASGGEPPTLDDFRQIGPFVSSSSPSRALNDRELYVSPRRNLFIEAAGARPVAELLRDPECQGVLRVLFDTSGNWVERMVLTTLRFTSDGLHVHSAHFGYQQMDAVARRELVSALRDADRWKDLLICEEKSLPVKTRNDLAGVLDGHIRISTLESVACGGGAKDKGRIGMVPGPRTNRARGGGYDLDYRWVVEGGAVGERSFSHSFTFTDPHSLADVRYMKLLLCVAEVCEPVRECLYVPSPFTLGLRPGTPPALPALGPMRAGPDIERPARLETHVGIEAPEAAAGETSLQSPELQEKPGLAWLHFLLGTVSGLGAGAAGGWLLLRHRRRPDERDADDRVDADGGRR